MNKDTCVHLSEMSITAENLSLLLRGLKRDKRGEGENQDIIHTLTLVGFLDYASAEYISYLVKYR
jgi:hypothetical protein